MPDDTFTNTPEQVDELTAQRDDARASARTAWDVHSEHVETMNRLLLREMSLRDEARAQRDEARDHLQAVREFAAGLGSATATRGQILDAVTRKPFAPESDVAVTAGDVVSPRETRTIDLAVALFWEVDRLEALLATYQLTTSPSWPGGEA